MQKHISKSYIFLFIALISLSCTFTAPQNSASALETTALPPQPENSQKYALYFLSNQSNTFQIWKTELGTNHPVQITNAPGTIDEYAVSETSGAIAYILNNQLFLQKTAASTAEIIFDGGDIDPSKSDQLYISSLSGIVWSHDGNTLAYGHNGINFYSPTQNSHSKVLSNQINQDENGASIPIAIYHPISWSPNNTQLLINIESVEGWQVASFQLSNNQVIKLNNQWVCCTMYWLEDNQSLLVGNPYIGATFPGLWHYNTTTGAETEMIPSTSAEGTLNFVGWPKDMGNGKLRYLFANTASYPESSPPLILVESSFSDLSNPNTLRPETWPIIDALWSTDGSFIIVVQTPLGETVTPYSGPILQIDAEGNPPIPISANGYNLQWGP